MNARYCTAALFVMFGLALSALVAPASAASPAQPYLVSPGGSYGLPKFGFSSATIYGYGERVVFVRPGSRAAFLGLEPGDVLLSLNGLSLTYTGSWTDALSHAAYHDGGYIRLKIRDVRTGHIFFRETYVNYGGGPVEHYYKSHPHVTPKVVTHATPHVHFQAKPILPKIKIVK
jgi:membrane-associated protease RseP (regulator of RpoE activity)